MRNGVLKVDVSVSKELQEILSLAVEKEFSQWKKSHFTYMFMDRLYPDHDHKLKHIFKTAKNFSNRGSMAATDFLIKIYRKNHEVSREKYILIRARRQHERNIALLNYLKKNYDAYTLAAEPWVLSALCDLLDAFLNKTIDFEPKLVNLLQKICLYGSGSSFAEYAFKLAQLHEKEFIISANRADLIKHYYDLSFRHGCDRAGLPLADLLLIQDQNINKASEIVSICLDSSGFKYYLEASGSSCKSINDFLRHFFWFYAGFDFGFFVKTEDLDREIKNLADIIDKGVFAAPDSELAESLRKAVKVQDDEYDLKPVLADLLRKVCEHFKFSGFTFVSDSSCDSDSDLEMIFDSALNLPPQLSSSHGLFSVQGRTKNFASNAQSVLHLESLKL